jgi:hypothetical protein
VRTQQGGDQDVGVEDLSGFAAWSSDHAPQVTAMAKPKKLLGARGRNVNLFLVGE